MSEVKDIFYNLFWQNKVCRNLFLLSKEELLDTKSIILDEDLGTSVSYPRIIISNVDKNDSAFQTLKIRTESNQISKQSNLQSKIEKYQPLFSNFIESNFSKSLEKIITDLDKQPTKVVKLVGRFALADKKKREKLVIELLQNYGLIGKHINSLSDLEAKSEQSMRRIIKGMLSEENVWNILEFVKSVKDIYTNSTFEEYYSSNQILVNALFSADDFQSRILLFTNLYDIGILSLSNEDSFVECVHCPSGTYRGSLQIKMSPSKLRNLNCPVCNQPLNYYVPYQLHDEIYQAVKSKDGLIQDALLHKLNRSKIAFKSSQMFLGDIEVDCTFDWKGESYLIESKMFKQSTTRDKLATKIREAFSKLLKDAESISRARLLKHPIVPLLLVNVPDGEFIKFIRETFVAVNKEIIGRSRIITIENIGELIKRT